MSGTDLAYALVLVSGALHATVNAILKAGNDKLVGRALIDAASAVLALPALAFVPLPTGAWTWLIASLAIHLVYLYALVRAFEVGDFSAAYPVARGTAPLLTALVVLGVFHEPARPLELVGIIAIGAGMLVMGLGRHLSRAALGWSLLTGVCIAAYTVVDAWGVRAAPSGGSYIAWLFVLHGAVISTVFAALRGPGVLAVAREQWRPGVVAGVLSLGTYGLALAAYRLGPTAPLAALRETSILVATAIAVFWLKERVTPLRAAAAVVIALGAASILAS
ncbi:DMT family transporter [Nannocystis sp. SCPEA4]|uniref:DMT family transporter n=1 Tax=Nannocystis sp. SCPEA4 TaxID=2996787 RepID=UPI0022711E4B|nr:DMT family transporter [Nannocystis sp. SCPEA4]MCY1059247.1 DMT family transporter [Nannocystis sp. SCPEA4]